VPGSGHCDPLSTAVWPGTIWGYSSMQNDRILFDDETTVIKNIKGGL